MNSPASGRVYAIPAAPNTGHSKDDYLEMASHIPEVQERLNAGESLSSLEKDPVVGECAKNYFDPANMPIVSQCGAGMDQCR